MLYGTNTHTQMCSLIKQRYYQWHKLIRKWGGVHGTTVIKEQGPDSWVQARTHTRPGESPNGPTAIYHQILLGRVRPVQGFEGSGGVRPGPGAPVISSPGANTGADVFERRFALVMWPMALFDKTNVSFICCPITETVGPVSTRVRIARLSCRNADRSSATSPYHHPAGPPTPVQNRPRMDCVYDCACMIVCIYMNWPNG